MVGTGSVRRGAIGWNMVAGGGGGLRLGEGIWLAEGGMRIGRGRNRVGREWNQVDRETQ